jgi:hypothetical protein
MMFVKHIGTLNLAVDYALSALSHLIERHGKDLLPPISDERWNALIRIFQRPWFSRLWTLQEVVVPEEVIFFCGINICAQKFLYQAAPLIGRTHHFREQWQPGIPACHIAGRHRTLHLEKREIPLLLLLLQTISSFQCKEPSDKIFAILGLQSTSAKLPIEAHYEAPVADVYTNCAKALIKASSSLQVLTVPHGPRSGDIEGLPLWVPDWSTPPRVLGLDFVDLKGSKFHACGPLQYREISSASQFAAKQLIVAGKVLDTIDAIIDLEFEDTFTRYEMTQFFERLMSHVLQKVSLYFHCQNLPPSVKDELLLKLIRTTTIDGFLRESSFKNLGWTENDWKDDTVLQMLERLAAGRSTSLLPNNAQDLAVSYEVLVLAQAYPGSHAAHRHPRPQAARRVTLRCVSFRLGFVALG